MVNVATLGVSMYLFCAILQKKIQAIKGKQTCVEAALDGG